MRKWAKIREQINNSDFIDTQIVASNIKIYNNLLCIITCSIVIWLIFHRSQKRFLIGTNVVGGSSGSSNGGGFGSIGMKKNFRLVDRLIFYLMIADIYRAFASIGNNFQLNNNHWNFMIIEPNKDSFSCQFWAAIDLHSNLVLVWWSAMVSLFFYLWVCQKVEVNILRKRITRTFVMICTMTLIPTIMALMNHVFGIHTVECWLRKDLSSLSVVYYFNGWIFCALSMKVISLLITVYTLRMKFARILSNNNNNNTNNNDGGMAVMLESLQMKCFSILLVNLIVWSADIVANTIEMDTYVLSYLISDSIGWLDSVVYIFSGEGGKKQNKLCGICCCCFQCYCLRKRINRRNRNRNRNYINSNSNSQGNNITSTSLLPFSVFKSSNDDHSKTKLSSLPENKNNNNNNNNEYIHDHHHSDNDSKNNNNNNNNIPILKNIFTMDGNTDTELQNLHDIKMKKDFTIFTTTFNMAEVFDMKKMDLTRWIPLDYDIYAISLQECMHLNEMKEFIHHYLETKNSHSFKYECYSKEIGSTTKALGFHGYIVIMVFVKKRHIDEKSIINLKPSKSSQLTGVNLGIAKAPNKGTVGICFRIHDSTIAFIGGHFSSDSKGSVRTERRYHDAINALQQTINTGVNGVFDVHLRFHHTIILGDLNFRIQELTPDEILTRVTHAVKKDVTTAFQKSKDNDTMMNTNNNNNNFASRFIHDAYDAILNTERHHFDDNEEGKAEVVAIDIIKDYCEKKGIISTNTDNNNTDTNIEKIKIEIKEIDEIEKNESSNDITTNNDNNDNKYGLSYTLWDDLLQYDELINAMNNCLIFNNFAENKICFPPSFRRVIVDDSDNDKDLSKSLYLDYTLLEEIVKSYSVEAKDGTIRRPSYTDRILIHSLPCRKKMLHKGPYFICDGIQTSDHRPVSQTLYLYVDSSVSTFEGYDDCPVPVAPEMPPPQVRKKEDEGDSTFKNDTTKRKKDPLSSKFELLQNSLLNEKKTELTSKTISTDSGPEYASIIADDDADIEMSPMPFGKRNSILCDFNDANRMKLKTIKVTISKIKIVYNNCPPSIAHQVKKKSIFFSKYSSRLSSSRYESTNSENIPTRKPDFQSNDYSISFIEDDETEPEPVRPLSLSSLKSHFFSRFSSSKINKNSSGFSSSMDNPIQERIEAIEPETVQMVYPLVVEDPYAYQRHLIDLQNGMFFKDDLPVVGLDSVESDALTSSVHETNWTYLQKHNSFSITSKVAHGVSSNAVLKFNDKNGDDIGQVSLCLHCIITSKSGKANIKSNLQSGGVLVGTIELDVAVHEIRSCIPEESQMDDEIFQSY